ncbi:LysE family translocator [Sorangium sp. So ce1128]
MPVDTTGFAIFIMAVLAICITPGPEMLYVLANGIHQGPKAGVISALGMATGNVFHTAAAALGLAAFFSASPLLFKVVQYAGAAYLFWIGVQTFREPVFNGKLKEREHASLFTIWQRAVITNLLNPKIIIFYVAFLPQFVRATPGLSSVAGQFVFLGMTFLLIGLAVDVVLGILSGTLNTVLAQNATFSRCLNWFSALVFVGLAVRLVLAN